MKNLGNIFLLLIFLFITSHELNAQISIKKKTGTIHFEHHNLNNSSPKSLVNTFIQDRYGFLWISTYKNLFKYDGIRFNEHYTKTLKHIIGDDIILTIYEDPEFSDHLWIATNKSVSIIDRKNEKFSTNYSEKNIIDFYQIKNVNQIVKDKNGRCWFMSSLSLIFLLEPGSEKINEVYSRLVSKEHILGVFEHPSSNRIFAVSRKGNIFIYDEVLRRFKLSLASEYQKICVSFFFDKHTSSLWLGTYLASLIKIDIDSQTQKFYPLALNKLSFFPYTQIISTIYVDDSGTVWAGTNGEGLIEYDPLKNLLKRYIHDELIPSSILNNEICAIFQDMTGLMWIGYKKGNISHFKKRQQLVDNYSVSYREKSSGKNKLSRIFEMRNMQDDKILAGSRKGVFIFSLNKNNDEYQLDFTNIRLDAVSAIEFDHQGNYWIGTFKNAIWIFNKQLHSFRKFKLPLNLPKKGSIFDILEDSDHDLWFLISSAGLIKYSRKNDKATKYNYPFSHLNISKPIAYCVLEEIPGVLIIGTNNGVFRFHKSDESFQKLIYYQNKTRSLSNIRVTSLLKSKNGLIYMGTIQGLFVLSPGDSIFTNFEAESELGNLCIKGIVEDGSGNLWISSKTRIIKFIISESKIISFDKMDGLGDGSLTYNSIVLHPNGDLVFGRSEGFSVFHTNEITKDKNPSPIVITNYQALKESVIIGNEENLCPLMSSSSFEYDYLTNIFRIEFSALDFTDPTRNRYMYKMEGINDQWIDLGNKNFVTFVNLPPKSYRFHVKGANSEGLWNEEPLTIDIEINPPYWQSWWFWSLTLLLIFVAVYLLNYQRLQRIRKRNIQLQIVNKELNEQISIREEMENMLRESEEKYRTLVGSIQQDIFTCDEKGRLYFVNDIVSRRIDGNAGDLLGKHVTILYPDLNKDQINKKINDAAVSNVGLEFDIQSMDEHFPKYLHFSFQPLHSKSKNKNLLLGIATDLSDQKRLEEQLRQSQKLEAVGKLAGGIAHDFNNLIAVIRGYSDLLLTEIEKDTEAFENIEEIDKAGERAAILVRQLLAFSRRQMLEPQVLSLNELIQNLEKMLSRIIPENIELWVHHNPNLFPIYADPGQIEQVIMNLFVNAKDAMPNGGKLSIRTKNANIIAEDLKKYPQMILGEYVLLEITDTGVGISSDIIDNIFEPFFTTKEKGEGTGLGLSTVFGIVKQSNGYIFVDSNPGAGSQFSVFLPKAIKAMPEKQAELPVKRSKGGGETILVVEDEAGLKKMIVKMLKSQNYNVLVGSNGKEALQASKEYDGKIHLLLTDVVMPGMNGRELAEELHKDRKDLIILYMSGYTDDQLIQKEILQPGTQYLQKPFPPQTLSEKIKIALRQK